MLQRVLSPAAFLPLFCLCITSAALSPAESQLSDSAYFLQVKERSLRFLLGEESGGPYRKAAIAQLDQWTTSVLRDHAKPLVWDERAAPQMNQRMTALASQLERLAIAFSSKGSRYQNDPALKSRIVAGIENVLQYYQPGGPRPGNWYQWLISLPRHLGAIGLLMEDDLPSVLLNRLKTTLRHELTPRLVLTGTNASWEARNHIYLALLEGDIQRLHRAADYVFQFVRYGPDEGVREDYCYLFHGNIPYAGGYGSGFAQTVAEFIYVFDDTPWAIAPNHRDIIRNLLLEHTRWFLADGTLDLHVRGRTFMRDKGNWNSVLEAMLVLAQTTDPRKDELAATAAAMIRARPDMQIGLTSAGFADILDKGNARWPSGYRYFPSGEIGVFRNDDFHIGFRQFSSRVQDYEYLMREDGGEGGQGWNLPYGFTNIIRQDGSGSWYHNRKDDVADNSDEEDGMWPDIDVDHLPGTTVRVGATPENPPFVKDASKPTMSTTGFSLNFGKSRFAGGAGYGNGGVAGFVLEPVYGDLTAKKSLHFFDNGFWALGSDIVSTSSTDADKPIHTTILQWPCDQPQTRVFVNDKVVRPGSEETILRNTRWIWIEGEDVAIIFDAAADVHVRMKGNIFMVWLDHGTNPAATKYAYAVLPLATRDGAREFADKKPFRPARYDAKVHAVADSKNQQQSLVFFEGESCLGIGSDRPAIVYHNRNQNGGVITIQDPLHQENPVVVTVDNLSGVITSTDDAINVTHRPNGSASIEMKPLLGRIYRLGYGTYGKSVTPEPRKDLDLSSYQDFHVEATSDAAKTVLTVYLPDHASTDDYRLSVHFSKSQRLYDFSETDIIERPSKNVIRYLWRRKPASGPAVFSDYFKLTHGRFNVLLVTEDITAMDSFTVPEFD